jgi:hypothetical protein
LVDIRGFARANRVELSGHAKTRCYERGITFREVVDALADARSCAAEPKARWRVDGTDRDGDALVLVVAIEDGLLVVTVY